MASPGKILYPHSGSNLLKAVPCSFPQTTSPITVLKDALVLTQKFMQWGKSFVPLDLNTEYISETNFVGASAWTEYAGYYLVSESERQEYGGVYTWTRTFAKVPPQYVEPTTVQYQFIAFYPGVTTVVNGVVVDQGRGTVNANASGIAVYDFALITDPAALDTALPPALAQYYGYANNPPAWTYIPFTDTTQLYPADFADFQGNVQTYPTIEAYKNWITVLNSGTEPTGSEGANPQTADQPFPRNYMIRPVDAERYPWMGNIWCRRSIYINPQ